MIGISHQLKKIGPGLLMAGAAIGVSHLVQSTRAGAEYGFQLIGLVILTNLLKYPFLEIGPRYAQVTGKHMLYAYQEMGRWALWVYGIFTAGTMFIIMAALSLFCGSIVAIIVPLEVNPITYSILVQVVCMGLLIKGRYTLLNKMIRWIMAILFVSSLVALILTLLKGPVSNPFTFDLGLWELGGISFLLALMGWMPIPLDAAVWHSIWVLEHNKEMKKKSDFIEGSGLSLKDSLLDFNIGYVLAATLSVLFLALGAYVMFGSGQVFSDSGIGFTTQLIELYTTSLGSWSFFIIATAAFFTMLSTCLTVMDSIPRVWQEYFLLSKGSLKVQLLDSAQVYTGTMLLLFLGSVIILYFFLSSFKALIDLATILSFLIAPILAFMNYKVMLSLPLEYQWSKSMKRLSYVGMAFLAVFALFFLYWLTLNG